jgi:hypothetical protein
MFSNSSALISRRQLIDASEKAGASNISRVYQQKASPGGGPQTFSLFMVTALDQTIASECRVSYQNDRHTI